MLFFYIPQETCDLAGNCGQRCLVSAEASEGFFRWYNEEHRHSGLGLLTPATVHYGQAESVLQQRQAVLAVAYQLPGEVWINKPVSVT